MKLNVFKTLSQAYMNMLASVWYSPDYESAPRGQAVREILNYTFTVLYPTSQPITTNDPERNRVIAEYTAKEHELYHSGSNDVADFAKASKFWNKLANPDGTVNSAYGYLIWHNKSHGHQWFERGHNQPNMANEEIFRTPWEWAKLSLEQDKDTRQAILRFSLPEHAWVGNKDQVCTQHASFMIRDDKLHMTVVMRANDGTKGLAYDAPFFVSLMEQMVQELLPTYPTLTIGHYTHIAHSMHLYERDEQVVLAMLGHTNEVPL